MPWDDLCLPISQRQDGIRGLDHSLNRASMVHVDERVKAVEEDIPGVDDVGVLKVDHAVPVGVCAGHVKGVQCVVVQVESDVGGEGNHRKRSLRLRRCGHVKGFDHGFNGHPLPHLVVGEDHGARLAEVLISTRVVGVIVRVDQELRYFSARGPDRLQVLRC